MIRLPSTTRTGASFDAATIEAVWRKGETVSGYDPATYRKESCGAWIQRSAYGTTGDYGWEIDHIMPVSKGGSDSLSNLQPLLWSNNRHKGDDYPNWSCVVSAKVA